MNTSLPKTGRATPIRGARGFTLVELMIAVTIGLVLLAALTTMFVQTSANRAEMDRGSRQIENGRYAMSTLREDVALMGFYSDASQVGVAWQSPEACTTALASIGFSPMPLQMPLPVFGYAGGSGAPACVADAVAGTDVLVIRRLNTEPTPPASVAPSQYYLQISHCATDSSTTPLVFAAGSSAGAFALRRVNCATPADAWRYREHVYYVRDYSATPGDGIPTLVRLELDGGAMAVQEIAEGIQDLRLDYGIDTNGDGTPESWRRCNAAAPCTAADWSNVTAIKVNILSRTLERTPDYSDAKSYDLGLSGTVGPFGTPYKYHVYSAVVNATNRSGPRER